MVRDFHPDNVTDILYLQEGKIEVIANEEGGL